MKRLVTFGALAAIATTSHAIVIDTFSDGVFSQSLTSGSWVGSQAGVGLGGERDSAIQLISNNLGLTGTLEVSGGYFSVSGAPDMELKIGLDYDGAGDETDGFVPFEVGPGIGPVDLTQDSGNSFQIAFQSNDLALHMAAFVFSAGGGESRYDATIAAGQNFIETASYADFIGTANFAAADRVAFIFDTAKGGDFALNQISTAQSVPEPASVAILGLGAISLLRRKRR
jgi:hypothetical protein